MRLLYITTIGGTMGFFKTLIKSLINDGYDVDIACNITDSPVPDCYYEWGCKVYHISCFRSPIKKANIDAIRQIKKIVTIGKYDIVHCHTPIAAACTRIACQAFRKKGLRVIYTAHGFHFFKGAPLKNWMVYYPVEKLCSRWTDILITINKEDYQRAQKKMNAGEIVYVPGVGIDLKKIAHGALTQEEKQKARERLGIRSDEKMLLSAGELNHNKNHETVIRALVNLRDTQWKYFICGSGELQEYLQNLIIELGLTDRVFLLGFRNDVLQLCDCADLYVFPSFREGLSVALMEAIATKTAVIVSNIRGNMDLVDMNALFDPYSVDDITERIKEYLKADKAEEISNNYEHLQEFDLSNVIVFMKDIYESCRR